MTVSDQPLYRQLFSSKKIMQWIAEPLTDARLISSFAAALQYNNGASDELVAGGRLFLVIAERPAHLAVGLMAATFTAANATSSAASVNAEVGIMLLPSAQRKGLAHEALAGLCQWLSRRSEVNNIICNITNGNLAAKKLVTALGFVYCKQANYYKLEK
ncbi:GNAT family N-acetyltransferase [Arsukibacterium indicum]|uniref:GNAT family N-acetyltransferase n=1 Tax=Arsukibacterium indicum TaxID=2848612 RepID=A0ABS6MLX3_9GAMM|nr:GNAT family N-acetyltransferase [Arsukibacterium indicum]MBV2129794.1 GNAT family N-acetyltransferase [Arsukibacterium indicum]